MGIDSCPKIIERSGSSTKTQTIMPKDSSLLNSVGGTIITGAYKIDMGAIDKVAELVQMIVGWVAYSIDSSGRGERARVRIQ